MPNNHSSKLREIEVDVVKKAIDTKEDMLLLDVRTRQEYIREHVNGSINIPVDELLQRIEKLFPDKKKKIYVYCLSGSRSGVAVETLRKLGYTKAYGMKYGLLGWRVKKYPL